MIIEQRMVELTIKHSLAEGRKLERADVVKFLQGNLAGVQVHLTGESDGKPRLTLELDVLDHLASEKVLTQLIETFKRGDHQP